MYTKACNVISQRFQKYVSWTWITIYSASEKKTRVKDLPVVKMRRNNRKTRVNKPRNWIRREREFVSFLPMQETRPEGSEARHQRIAKFLTDGIWRSLTRIDISRRRTFFLHSQSAPPYSADLRRPPLFGISVQRPWPLARGGANELR